MKKLNNIILYSTDDVCKLFRIGKLKCLELFHRDDFPAVKIGRNFWIEHNALMEYISTRKILTH